MFGAVSRVGAVVAWTRKTWVGTAVGAGDWKSCWDWDWRPRVGAGSGAGDQKKTGTRNYVHRPGLVLEKE